MLTWLFKDIMNKQKTYTLTPSWKYFFLAYALSILAAPLLIGVVALYFVRKYHKSISYVISDMMITAIDDKYEQNIDIVNIQKVELRETWRKKLGIGTLVIHTEHAKVKLLGLDDPESLKNLIEKAAESLKKQAEEAKVQKESKPEYKAGNRDKLNYLTGLWQQGLISDEDFEEERRHFE